MKYQIVRQHREEDCGAASLATIVKHYQRTKALDRIRSAVGTGQLGTNMLGLKQGAEALGFNTRCVRAPADMLDQMNQAPLPAIIHWKGNHWVVLYGQRGQKYVIADPAAGIRYLDRNELTEGWQNRVMLLLLPDPVRFYAEPDDIVGGFSRFLKRVWPYRAIVLEALLIAQVIGLLSLASPFLIQILTDDVLVRGDSKLLATVAITVIVMNLVSSSLRLVVNNLIAHFAQRLQLGLEYSN